MKNQIVAKILYDIADLLEIKGVDFKPYAYRRAAQTIESLPRDIEDIYKEGKLEELPGIGKAIAEKIKEIIDTGSSKSLDDLKKKIPIDVESLLSIGGLGPKKVSILYKKLKIKNLNDLERAAKHGNIRKLEGFGEKTEQDILKNIDFKRKNVRTLLGDALPLAEEIIDRLKHNGVSRAMAAGSIRRMKETIGDIDILVVSKNPDNVMGFFTKMNDVKEILAKGDTKSSVILNNGMQADVRVVKDSEFGSALMYFTGSKEHNIALRKIAISKKMKLSEYGLFSGNKQVAGCTDEEVYRKLGLQYVEPEMRENSGEIGLSQKNNLPKLVDYRDIKGDLQMHTKWSDGQNTIEEMAAAAKHMDYEYICITDHAGSLAIANGLDEKRLMKQIEEIKRIGKSSNIKILSGLEVNIKSDGSLDMNDTILKKLDVVVAGVHSGFKRDNTDRIMKAMDNANVDIIVHPTGRVINQRKEYDVDVNKIIDKAKETGTILEIDSIPRRLDLNDVNARMAIEHGCKLSINTDAHSIEKLSSIRLGIGVARRAWAQKKDIINTNSLEKMLKCLK